MPEDRAQILNQHSCRDLLNKDRKCQSVDEALADLASPKTVVSFLTTKSMKNNI